MASGDTLCVFMPYDNEPPASNYATLDVRNYHPCLDFDTTTQEAAVFTGVMPRHYSGGGITVYLHWAATSATTGTIGWTLELERMSDNSTDLDADSFATAVTVTAATVPSTSGVLAVTSATVSGASLDGVTAGDSFRLRIKRDVANDDAAGDAELYAVEIKEA